MTNQHNKVRVAIIGVGNCASSFVQGVEYYKNASDDVEVPGLMHVNLGGYHISDIELPYGNFWTRLTTLRADVAFTNALYWENIVQYDNVSNSLGINSIFRWVPRAGREVILVVNREFIDYLRDRTFNSVTGDITFKFGYTFRF